MTYPSFEAALVRVEQLKRDIGVWPGIRRRQDGWQLTMDVPDLVTAKWYR